MSWRDLFRQRRGAHVQPAVGLPEGFEPPSAALWPPGGMYVDPAQTPTTLMEPSMEAGQPPARGVAEEGQR